MSNNETTIDQENQTGKTVTRIGRHGLKILGTAALVAVEIVLPAEPTTRNSKSRIVSRLEEEMALGRDQRKGETLQACGKRYVERLLGVDEKGQPKKSLAEISPEQKEHLTRMGLQLGIVSMGISHAEAVNFTETIMREALENRQLMDLIDKRLVESVHSSSISIDLTATHSPSGSMPPLIQ